MSIQYLILEDAIMSREITIDNVVIHKKKAIKSVSDVFEAYINNPDSKYLKKADLLAFWLEAYCKYILEEETFNYSSVPKYKRGEVISVDFGFNVGSEHGGKHYAIVLDNDNKQSSRVITVIPLSSGTSEKTYERDVYLGNELYDKLKKKYDDLRKEYEKEKEIAHYLSLLIESENDTVSEGERVDYSQLLEEKLKNIADREKDLNNYEKELSRLKYGSRALMEQLTTVSKMRIYQPKKSSDLLYGIKFSDGAMDKINDKLKELFVFTKN